MITVPGPLSIFPPLIISVVLIASGIAKLRHPDDLDGWTAMGVPAPLRRTWLLRFHPWGEIVLGLALAVLGGLLGTLAATVALLLMLAYLVFVVRTVRSGADTSCACFGERRRVTGATVTRNSWYVLLSAAAAATVWADPLWGGPLAAVHGDGWLWLLGLAAAALTVVVTMWPEPAASAPAHPGPVVEQGSVGDDEELLDYIRTRTPAVPVMLADGTEITLRQLSLQQPLLLLAVNPGCGACTKVMESTPQWRELLPEVSIRFLLTDRPGASEATERTEPQSVHDPHQYVRDSIGDWFTPSAVLLGMDGQLAGGPVTGYAAIAEFVADVYESLHGERPPA
ncbi:MauE/DoxX family redox-associated membrane protein [Microbacterium sp.]|uniref:MauE/DoxX family redox-associated membrane protein n=1 Tax=Microbacterium sp. TaxID=51671 RepID=UPI00334085F2